MKAWRNAPSSCRAKFDPDVVVGRPMPDTPLTQPAAKKAAEMRANVVGSI